MEVLQELSENKGIAIALGFFDGIHVAHKKILNTLKKYADNEKIKTAVLTFDKNPASYFSEEEIPQIQTYKDREIMLEFMGIDFLYELNFEEFKEMSAEEYIEKVLVKYFNPKFIVVGYNHTFGKDKTGTPSLLKEYSSVYGYKCIIVSEQKYDDTEEISSTAIRKYIQTGCLSKAKLLLGRNFSVRNSVIKGSKMATALGCPTANLIWPNSMIKLPYGVYYGYSQIANKLYPSLISWGTKPTVTDGKEEILESHIYNYNENLYGKILKVIFERKVRNEEKFSSPLMLKAQIAKDKDAFEAWAKTALKID